MEMGQYFHGLHHWYAKNLSWLQRDMGNCGQIDYVNTLPAYQEYLLFGMIDKAVSPVTGVGRSIKAKKFTPRFIGPYEILERIGHVACQIVLPSHLSSLHDVFHMSQLKKYYSDLSHVIEPKEVEL
ncbi:uncharacterized protein LOC114741715 [Neltuma alba]|uniref:uncharacterized protein LOC114741715 n=1 Tax=Neltuma alba TaxID=207710 RepID=UPI0010A49627|nr:uncharacterized protein LOC114741715 [Prosopis alba]